MGVKKLFTQMLQFAHMPNFGIETNGPEKVYTKCFVSDRYSSTNRQSWREREGANDEIIRSSKDDNDRINLRDMISEAQKLHMA